MMHAVQFNMLNTKTVSQNQKGVSASDESSTGNFLDIISSLITGHTDGQSDDLLEEIKSLLIDIEGLMETLLPSDQESLEELMQLLISEDEEMFAWEEKLKGLLAYIEQLTALKQEVPKDLAVKSEEFILTAEEIVRRLKSMDQSSKTNFISDIKRLAEAGEKLKSIIKNPNQASLKRELFPDAEIKRTENKVVKGEKQDEQDTQQFRGFGEKHFPKFQQEQQLARMNFHEQTTHELNQMLSKEVAENSKTKGVANSQLNPSIHKQILFQVQTIIGEGKSEITFQLEPQELGRLQLKIVVENGAVLAKLAAESIAAKQMIESNLPQLRQSLEDLGLKNPKLEVSVQQEFSRDSFQKQAEEQLAFKRKINLESQDSISEGHEVSKSDVYIELGYSTIDYLA